MVSNPPHSRGHLAASFVPGETEDNMADLPTYSLQSETHYMYYFQTLDDPKLKSQLKYANQFDPAILLLYLM